MSTRDISLTVFRHLFASVTEEMGEALRQSAVSANIKERRDFSCALLDERGRLISHAAHIPVHLGSAPLTVPAVLKSIDPQAGDVVVLNDPHRGGTHLNDVTVVAPIFVGNRRVGFLLNRAHHNDVGGLEPGGLTGASCLAEEGICIAPCLLVQKGQKVLSVWQIFEQQMREPQARVGDLQAQCAALHRGADRFDQLLMRFGVGPTTQAMHKLHSHASKLCRAMLKSWPDKRVRVKDFLDGAGSPKIQLQMTKLGGNLKLDFSGTSAQVPASWNTHRAVVLSAVAYVLQSIANGELPESGGILSPIKLHLPARSLLSSQAPAGVAVGNTETSQRLVDVLFEACAKFLPKQIPAASHGSMNNVCFGGERNDGSAFVYYETLGGGCGAGPNGPGASVLQVHMTNTLNTPVEVLESELPVRVVRHAKRRASGGIGLHRGGDGLIKEIEFLKAVRLGVIATRRNSSPPGRNRGGAAKPGRDRVRINNRWRSIAAGETLDLKPGDRLLLESSGGAGWGVKP